MNKAFEKVLQSPLFYGVVVGVAWYFSSFLRHDVQPAFVPPSTPSISVPSFRVSLSASDLEFGRSQVLAMMRDRSEMSTCVQPEDEIFQWAVRQYAGEATGRHTYWDNSSPDCPPACMANNQSPSMLSPGLIKIREFNETGPLKGTKVSGEDLWCCFVFESFNISNFVAFWKNAEDGRSGGLTKAQWMNQLARIEFQAIPKTKSIYYFTWKPMMEKKGLPTNPYHWYMNVSDDVEQWLADPLSQPYAFYEPLYEKYIAPYKK